MFLYNPCCCLNLRTGVFLIGVLEIISWSVALRESVVALAFTIGMSSLIQSAHNGTELDQDAQYFFESAYVITGLLVSLCVVRIIIGCILLFGIQRNSVRMVTAWICVKSITLFIAIGTFIASICFETNSPQSHVVDLHFNDSHIHTLQPDNNFHKHDVDDYSTSFTVGSIVFYLINFGAGVYFIWCAYCLVKEMRIKAALELRYKVDKS